jgi:hypothetical protein
MTDPAVCGDGHMPELPEIELAVSQVILIGGPPRPQDHLRGRRIADWRPGLLVLVLGGEQGGLPG